MNTDGKRGSFGFCWTGSVRSIRQVRERVLQTHPNLRHYTVCNSQDRADLVSQRKIGLWTAGTLPLKSGGDGPTGESSSTIGGGANSKSVALRNDTLVVCGRGLGQEHLTRKRLKDCFEVTREDAGKRYDPQVNVPLQISMLFDALLRERHWYDELNSLGKEVDRRRTCLVKFCGDERFSRDAERADSSIDSALSILARFGRTPSSVITPETVLTSLRESIAVMHDLAARLDEVPLNAEEQQEARHHRVQGRPRPTEQHDLRRLWIAVEHLSDFLGSDQTKLASGSPLFLTGQAGAGKTHLICDAADKRLREDAPALVFLGQWFSSGDPLQQMVQKFHIDCQPPAFLEALCSIAEAHQRKALLAIDALNDSDPRRVWRDNLAGLLTVLSRYPWISVAVSCRNSYISETIPDGVVAERVVIAEHHGFGEQTHEAVRRYFDHYNVARPRTPLVMPEFRNPLFLRLYCRALSHKPDLPLGSSVLTVFETFLDAVDEILSRPDRLDYNRTLRPLLRSIDAIAAEMITQRARRITTSRALEITEEILPGRPWSRSILNGLQAEGALITEPDYTGTECVSFQYERLGDYLLARMLLNEVPRAGLVAAFSGGTLAAYAAGSPWDSAGILEALAVQLPEKYGVELHEVLPRVGFDTFAASLIWRRSDAFTKCALDTVTDALHHSPVPEPLYDVFFAVAGYVGHPLATDFLDRYLSAFSMPRRDAIWTSYVNDITLDAQAQQLVAWATAIEPSNEYNLDSLFLVAVTLGWLLTASSRIIRDRCTKAIMQLLTGRLDVASRLIAHFANVNDPYVIERVAAACYGAATRTPEGVNQLSATVFEVFFEEPRSRRSIF